MKNKFKICIVLIIIVVVIILLILFILPIRIKYDDMHIPGASYDITINKLTLTLHSHAIHRTSIPEKSGNVTDNTVKLSFEEYWKAWFIYYFKLSDRESLVKALDSISSEDTEKLGNGNSYDTLLNKYDLNKKR